MLRAFLAVELTDDLRTRLADIQQDLRRRLSYVMPKTVRIAWVRPSSIHLTIKFLGDMDEQLIEPLRLQISHLMTEQRTMQIPLTRLGVFPRLQQPRVLWAGPSGTWEQGDDAVRLAALHRSVEGCCHMLGFAPEGRPLSPHLTLARIKEGERDAGRLLAQSGALDQPLTIGSLDLNAIALIRSELRPAGPVYTKLWEVGVERHA